MIISVETASGSDLDEAGEVLDNKRINGESDNSYRESILKEVPSDGGSAFPFGRVSEKTGHIVNGWGSVGMSLRDYFAAKAMQAIMSNMELAQSIVHESMSNCEADMAIAKAAYRQADAMLQERNK